MITKTLQDKKATVDFGQERNKNIHMLRSGEKGVISAAENPAVIGVLYTRGSVADPLLQLFLDNEPPFVPQGQNSTGPTVAGVDLRSTVKNYIPNGTAGSFLTYKGSLTTPPCTEGVQWLVSTLNATMTDAQIVALQAAIGGNETFSTNARPVQAGSPSQLITPL